MFQFDENQGFLVFFDEGQDFGVFAHTISQKAWNVSKNAVSLHRQSEQILMTEG